MKRGTHVEYTYAAGAVVKGVVVRQHKGDLSEWFVVKLTDEKGAYTGSCHRDQLRVTDNR